jgi:ATP adenylyltransferase
MAEQANDEQNYILYRGKHNFVILNAYPYNTGHLMVVPCRHGGNMDELTADEMADHLQIVSKSLSALKKAFEAQGFNIGMNIGKVAGAGVTDHLHTHIVPRWEGRGTQTSCPSYPISRLCRKFSRQHMIN